VEVQADLLDQEGWRPVVYEADRSGRFGAHDGGLTPTPTSRHDDGHKIRPIADPA
jgi:hypothetical protein